jgi:hypothetical protein
MINLTLIGVMVRRGCKTLLFALCVGLWSPSPAPANQDTRATEAEYLAIVDKFRSGQPERAVLELLSDGSDRLLGTVNRIVKMGSTFVGGSLASPSEFYRAASLMHADASFRLWSAGMDKRASAHYDLASALVDLSDRVDTTAPTFRPRWYLATALALTRLLPPAEAAARFEDACRRVPGDVRLLTAAGWFSERRSILPAAPGWNLRTAQTRTRQHQEEALRFLNTAVEADPRAPEATLRLAHLEGAMGHEDRSAKRLNDLLARDDVDRLLQYVAHLVLGGLQEGQGKVADAEQSYRAAIALHPVAQSARVALAALLYAAGHATEAADIVEPMLLAGEAREGNDPWSDYRLAYPSIGRLIFTDLVAEVQQ